MDRGKKHFLLGLGVGIALALGAVQFWSSFMVHTIADNSQPSLLRSFTKIRPELRDVPPDLFPKPWLPESQAGDVGGWQLESLNGKTLTLKDFRGKVLFLNFWSTSCAPCLDEMPGIVRLMAHLPDSQIGFAAVTEEDPSQVKDFLQKNKLALPIYFSRQPPPQNLPVLGVPTTYVLNKEGAVVFQHLGPLNWDDDASRAYLLRLAAQ
jgi:thiol-disulfide isomerase/thioredoxin